MPYQRLGKAIKTVADQVRFSETPAFDHAKNTIMAAISAIPYIGGPIATLIDKYIPSKKQERLLNFIKDLELSIVNIHESLDYNYIQTEEFAFIFEQTFKSVADNHQKEKLECYKAILLNTLKNPKSIPFEEKELYLRLVNNMTVLHVKILGTLDQIINRKVENPLTMSYNSELRVKTFDSEKSERTAPSKLTDQYAVLSELHKQLADYPEGIITLVIEDLERLGIIQRIEAHSFEKNKNSMLGISLVPPELLQSLRSIDLSKFPGLDMSKPHLVLTNFGCRLLSFLKEQD